MHEAGTCDQLSQEKAERAATEVAPKAEELEHEKVRECMELRVLLCFCGVLAMETRHDSSSVAALTLYGEADAMRRTS